MAWDQTSNTLCIGLDRGGVYLLKVSAELNYIKYSEVFNSIVDLLI